MSILLKYSYTTNFTSSDSEETVSFYEVKMFGPKEWDDATDKISDHCGKNFCKDQEDNT